MKLRYIIPVFLILAACNKDEEIYIPDDKNPNDNQTENSNFKSLDYSVAEYLPAPGQFINEVTGGFDKISSSSEASIKAKERLNNIDYLSLGAWGGFIVISLDSPLNNSGSYDFSIAGNSFDSSNEAGIIWVMKDENGNGKPDDIWYELKGSHFMEAGYERNFKITYFRPAKGKDTFWEASNGESGYISWLGNFHNQDFYYPDWIKEDSYTLSGSRLPARAEQNPVTGQWANLPFQWGYADNAGQDSVSVNYKGKKLQLNLFRISDAINDNGESIMLSSIDFIKVQTGIISQSGLLGENSTEICGFFSVP